jgi:hypothetical protein
MFSTWPQISVYTTKLGAVEKQMTDRQKQECSRLAFAKTGRSLQASDLTDEVHTAFLNLFGEVDADVADTETSSGSRL